MAEPGPDTGGSGQGPDVDTGPERINDPGDTNVNTRLSPPNLVDVLKYQDPLHTLLEYIAKVCQALLQEYPVMIECHVAIP